MSKPEKYQHINFTPPSGVRREAEYGLKLRREHGRGGTAVGIARARDLSNGVELSPSTVRRMKAFFDRHASDEKAEGFRQGEPGFPSNGKIANLLWGGPSGYSFAKKVVAQMEAADAKAEGRDLRPYGSSHGIHPRVVVVHGAPCSGKAAYVWKHKGDNDVVFDFNRIMESLSGSNKSRDDLVSYCLDIRTLILKKALRGKDSPKTWIITTKVGDDLKSQLSDVPVKYVHIEAPKEECLARLETERHPDDVEELRKVIEDYFSTEQEQRFAPAAPNVERRFLGNFSQAEKADPNLLRVERRSDPQSGKPRTYIVGYAATFGRDSLLLGDFVERIEPSAFDIVAKREDGEGKPLETRCLFNHSPDHLLGRFPTTMRMTVDEKGLKYECLLPESRSDLAELIERGDLKGSSFSFVIADGGERWTVEDGRSIRVVTAIKSLLDCGPVTYPAYGDASVSVAKRSYEQFCEQRDCGRDDGGKFGSGNKCQKDGEGGGESESEKKGLSGTAKGALFGAAIGAILGPGAIPGAAVGAVLGSLSRMFGKSKESLPKMSEGEAREKLAGMMQASKIANKTKMMNDDQLTSMVRAAGPEATFKPSGKGDQIMISKPDGSVFHVSNAMRGEGGKTTLMYAGKGQALVGSNNTAQISKPIDRAGISEAERLAKSAGIKKVVLFINEGDAKSQSAISATGGFSKGGPAGKGFERYSKSLSSPSKRSAGTPTSERAAKVSAEMRQFLESRNCGTGSGGFQKGNSCGGAGGGPTASKKEDSNWREGGAAGALVGGAIGGIAGLPAAAAGAVAGAVIGAIGGMYGNKGTKPIDTAMENVRVSEKKLDKAAKSLGESMTITGDGKTVDVRGPSVDFSLSKNVPSDLGHSEDAAENEKVHADFRIKPTSNATPKGVIAASKAVKADYVTVQVSAPAQKELFKAAGFKEQGGSLVYGKSYDPEKAFRRSYDELASFLAERRDCGRDEGGKFGSGNECQNDATGEKPKYMEWKKGDHLKKDKPEKTQEFLDDAREGQLARGGKDGGKSDDGGGVQTWSKGDDYPWTTQQVGTDEGYLQARHPDGSKTGKYPFSKGDTSAASEALKNELKKKKKSRASDVAEETLRFLRERARM